MFTFPLEQAPSNIADLFRRALLGEEILITEKDTPIIAIMPLKTRENYTSRVRALRGMLPANLDTTIDRDEDRV